MGGGGAKTLTVTLSSLCAIINNSHTHTHTHTHTHAHTHTHKILKKSGKLNLDHQQSQRTAEHSSVVDPLLENKIKDISACMAKNKIKQKIGHRPMTQLPPPPLYIHRSAIWLLHGWRHVKLLPSRGTFCVHHTTMRQFTVSLPSEPHMWGA